MTTSETFKEIQRRVKRRKWIDLDAQQAALEDDNSELTFTPTPPSETANEFSTIAVLVGVVGFNVKV